MNRPTQVRIGPFTWSIEYSDEALAAMDDIDGKQRLGVTCERPLRIVVGVAGRPEQAIRETVVHELLHAVNLTFAVRVPEYGDDKEEEMVATLATPLLGLLQDNPGLVAWLGHTEQTAERPVARRRERRVAAGSGRRVARVLRRRVERRSTSRVAPGPGDGTAAA